MSIEQYGFEQPMTQNDASGIPARITAVHREHSEFIDKGR